MALVGEHRAAVRALIDMVTGAGTRSGGVEGRLELVESHLREGVGRPAQLTLGRSLAEVKRGAEGAAAWAARWESDARFRRGMRVDTAV